MLPASARGDFRRLVPEHGRMSSATPCSICSTSRCSGTRRTRRPDRHVRDAAVRPTCPHHHQRGGLQWFKAAISRPATIRHARPPAQRYYNTLCIAYGASRHLPRSRRRRTAAAFPHRGVRARIRQVRRPSRKTVLPISTGNCSSGPGAALAARRGPGPDEFHRWKRREHGQATGTAAPSLHREGVG